MDITMDMRSIKKKKNIATISTECKSHESIMNHKEE